jgi:uncharacterized YceG family protein
VVKLLAAVAVVAVVAGCGGGKQPASSTTTVRELHQFRVVFPEGFTRAQMAERVQAVAKIAHRERHVRPKLSTKTYLAASGPRRIAGFGAKKLPLEGFLFPSTYFFDRKTTSAALVRAQLAAFESNFGNVDMAYAQSKNLRPYDVLKIASIIEREAVVPSERKLVAAVIYNRLHARMPLEIDATIRYGLDVPATESLRESQLRNPTPYNTRLHRGLPPTPIANPGLASIQAAAHPAKVDYLYFVRKPDKMHHFFTASFRAFQDYANAHGY